MNKSILMIMGGALVVAITVAMLVQSKLSSSPSASSAATVEILTAKRKLMTGERIQQEDVRWQAWPEDALFAGVIKRADQPDETKLAISEAPLRRDIEAGEPVTEQATVSDVKEGSNFLAAMLSPGMRAISISVKPETSVSGFLSPNDYVDVILSYQPKFNSTMQGYADHVVQSYASETILSNIKILAIDQEVRNQENAEATTAKTITLEVSKRQAEKLAMAQSMGEITLSLRRLGEKDTENEIQSAPTTDVGTIKLINKVGTLKDRDNSNTVRLYNGNAIQNIPVRAASH